MAVRRLPLSTFKIVSILNDCQRHTGTDIAKAVGVSRTAVWKGIQRLKKYNVNIRSEHLGYSLVWPLLLLNKKKIESVLPDIPSVVDIFETLPSTSDYLKKCLPSKKVTICLSEHQSRGRGRLGRSWESPFGRNIYCSFNYLFTQDASELSGLSLVVGILVVKALRSIHQRLTPLLKWPNDIYLDGKKAGGILIELVAEAHGNCTAIISFGLNVNMKGLTLQGIDQQWTSLEHSVEEKLDRNFVAGQVLRSIFSGLKTFQEKGFQPFLSEWKAYDLLEGKEVSLDTGQGIITGVAKGISPQGYLLIEQDSGGVKQCSYGDATLLKSYPQRSFFLGNGSETLKKLEL